MYSRKYIRPTLPERAAPADGIPTPPPDYAGIAFRPTDERTVQDYPETAIPAASSESRIGQNDLNPTIQMSHFVDRANTQPSISDADKEIGVQSTEADEEAITEIEPDAGLISAMDYLPEEIEERHTDAVSPSYEKADPVTLVQPDENALQSQPTLINKTVSPAALPNEAPSNEAASITAPQQPDSTASESSSSLAWLRALKMEDMLLLWLLLLLLSGESQDEIDLLLGLLIFAGH